MIRLLATLRAGERTVGEGVKAALGGKLDGAQAKPVEGRHDVRIPLVIEAGFDAEKNRHAPTGDDGTCLGHRAGDAHLIGVGFGEAMEGLDQAQRLLGRIVVVPIAVGADVLDDAIDTGGAR